MFNAHGGWGDAGDTAYVTDATVYIWAWIYQELPKNPSKVKVTILKSIGSTEDAFVTLVYPIIDNSFISFEVCRISYTRKVFFFVNVQNR